MPFAVNVDTYLKEEHNVLKRYKNPIDTHKSIGELSNGVPSRCFGKKVIIRRQWMSKPRIRGQIPYG